MSQYVAEIKARKSAKTAARYEYEITTFVQMCPVVFMDEINRVVVFNFMDGLKRRATLLVRCITGWLI
jgi:hypothetical protein